MTRPEEQLYHARWALQHLASGAGELQNAIDHLEHALPGATPEADTHPALTALRMALANVNASAGNVRTLVKGTLATAARESLAQTAPKPNACCGNAGTVGEGGRQHCATCGQEIT